MITILNLGRKPPDTFIIKDFFGQKQVTNDSKRCQ